jgi:hypothetical protein
MDRPQRPGDGARGRKAARLCEPAAVAYWFALAASLRLGSVLYSRILPTTDLGQWLMYARFYRGETIPAYRLPLAVPPLPNMLLAAIQTAVGGAPMAGIIAVSLVFFLLVLSAFWAVSTMYQDALAGAIAAGIVGFGQHLLPYLASFGGLSQLSAIAVANLGMVGLAKIGRNIDHRAGWLLLSGALFGVVFMHFPSVPVFFSSVAAYLVFLGLRRKCIGRILARSARFLTLPILAWCVYFWSYRGELGQYATNSAGYYRTGLTTVVQAFTGFSNNYWLAGLVVVAIASMIVTYAIAAGQCKETQEATLLAATFLVVPLGLMCVARVLQAGTDYSRFLYWVIQPPLFALAYALAYGLRLVSFDQIGSQTSSQLSLDAKAPRIPKFMRAAGALAILVLVMGNVRYTAESFPRMVNYFSVSHPSSLMDAINWLQAQKNPKVVLSPFLEAMWLEAFTGDPALYANKLRFLYRTGEIDRSLSADALANGNSVTAENGFVHVDYQLSNAGGCENPGLAGNHLGEYVLALTLQDRLIDITVDSGGQTRELNLARDFIDKPLDEPNSSAQSAAFVVTYASLPARPQIAVTKIVTLARDAPVATIVLDLVAVDGSRPVGVRLRFAEPTCKLDAGAHAGVDSRPINGSRFSSVAIRSPAATIIRHEDSTEFDTLVNLEFSPTPNRLEPVDHGDASLGAPYLDAFYILDGTSAARIGFRVDTGSTEKLPARFKVYQMRDILETFHVSHLLVDKGDEIQGIYDALGFAKVYENRDYILYASAPFLLSVQSSSLSERTILRGICALPGAK